MSSHHTSDCIDIRSIIDDSLVNSQSVERAVPSVSLTFDDWKSSKWCISDASAKVIVRAVFF